MPKKMTIIDVKNMPFYQMPKIFFKNDKYKHMRCESKLAYMLLQDLLPLSIQNNWVNKDGEVFVKLSRKKLMELLNIKGTQKFAQVMKELTNHNLIIYKQVGLSKCNEIYLLLPETKKSKDKDETPGNFKIKILDVGNSNPGEDEIQTHINTKFIKTNTTKNNINQSINYPKEDDEMIEGFYKQLEDQIHVENLKQRYDEGMVDEVINNIGEMYINKSTIVNKQKMPRSIIRGVIAKLKMHHIEHVIDQFYYAASRNEIYQVKKYIQTLIYNSIFEANGKIQGHIKYHLGY